MIQYFKIPGCASMMVQLKGSLLLKSGTCTLKVASFPGSPCFSVLQAPKSWSEVRKEVKLKWTCLIAPVCSILSLSVDLLLYNSLVHLACESEMKQSSVCIASSRLQEKQSSYKAAILSMTTNLKSPVPGLRALLG